MGHFVPDVDDEEIELEDDNDGEDAGGGVDWRGFLRRLLAPLPPRLGLQPA